MKRLAVMAHYDPAGRVAPYVRHQLGELLAFFDTVRFVTVAQLSADERGSLDPRLEVIERPNTGYDFYSYKVGLDGADLTTYDEVLLCNDTYVGPLVPFADIFGAMDRVEADFWGLTLSEEIAPHVQSYFVAFRRTALASPAFGDFWASMEPVSDRDEVIRRYEVGMSTRLHDAGLRSAAYFVPTAAELRRARRRIAWWGVDRIGAPRNRARARRLRRWTQRQPNVTVALADAALDGARLPVMKMATLRYDQYRLDAGRLLALGEQRHPAAFAGVRDQLLRTRAAYTDNRPHHQPRRWMRPLLPLVRYRAR